MRAARDVQPALMRQYVKEAVQMVEDGKQIAPSWAKKLLMPSELGDAL